ncbi:hypothetical protein HGM15179_003298 [Zosterops borbonicus]|uniref:CCHC-type domain-containing protein n=1 Tax=Zosterops borbonicus TaxID=364589 RepID=A0A8K1GSZ6_9PASS|nr:hypothetical protein HGM15179_003298 [Zosterops borbonicus]
MKTLREYGRDSPYFQGLLESSLAGQVVVPYDLKQLFRCLSNKTEFKLWQSTWKDLLGRSLPSMLRDPVTATDNGGDPITLDHLMGEGEWKSASDQAENIPEGVLELVKEKARVAFCEMRPAGPLQPYDEILQGPTEPFVAFVERLTAAIEQQVARVGAREDILEEMAAKNANEESRDAILRIPKAPGEHPTLDEMLKAASAMAATTRTRTLQRKKPAMPKIAAATHQERTSNQPRPVKKTPMDRPYFLCGQRGHWSSQCPKKAEFDNFLKKGGGGKGGTPNTQKN